MTTPAPRLTLSLALLVSAAAGPGRAETAEDSLARPTDGAGAGLFALNPAEQRPGGLQTGGLLLRRARTSVLDHTSTGRDKLTSTVSDDVLGAAVLADLGAGAGLGLTGQQRFRKVDTVFSQRPAATKTEAASEQLVAGKLIIELTDELRGAVVVRYVHRAVTLWGAPTLNAGMETRYTTSLIGFGSAFSYSTKTLGVGYAYYPPLHSKTEVYGEERIVVEPGEISVDLFVKPKAKLTIGFRGTRWLNEVDDLATGTTAANDKTGISLYGLDPDQYIVPQQRLELGADYAATERASLRVGLGQETDDAAFADYFGYQGVDVRQTGALSLKTLLLSGAARIVNNGVQVEGGITYFQRKTAFPDDWNGGSYEATGYDLYATASLKL